MTQMLECALFYREQRFSHQYSLSLKLCVQMLVFRFRFWFCRDTIMLKGKWMLAQSKRMLNFVKILIKKSQLLTHLMRTQSLISILYFWDFHTQLNIQRSMISSISLKIADCVMCRTDRAMRMEERCLELVSPIIC